MNKIILSNSCVEIQCYRGDTETQSLMSKVYPITSNRTKTQFRTSIHNCPEILSLLRGVDESNIHTTPPSIQNFYYREIAERRAIADLLENGPTGNPVVNKHLTLDPHQQLGREIAKWRDRYAFFYDTRTGKTPMSLAIMLDDISRNPQNKWLVICPLILIENAWMEDAERFVPEIGRASCRERVSSPV